MIAWLQVFLGFVLLILGGDGLVRGAVAIATRLGVSPLLIGLTLVGFGTSTPELTTCVKAALSGSPGIAIGNVIGSNIANILLIMGTAAVLNPFKIDRRAFKRDGAVLWLATLGCIAFILAGSIGRIAGAMLLGVLVSYIGYSYWRESKVPDAAARVHEAEAEYAPPAPSSLWLSFAFVVGGIGFTVLGAHCLVEGAVTLAKAFGVSESVIGLSVVAIGTSLPELATSISASLKRHGDIAFGNVVGSNIYNIFGILGATALVHPLAVPAGITRVDLVVMFTATVALTVFAVALRGIGRVSGGLCLVCYSAYCWSLFLATP